MVRSIEKGENCVRCGRLNSYKKSKYRHSRKGGQNDKENTSLGGGEEIAQAIQAFREPGPGIRPHPCIGWCSGWDLRSLQIPQESSRHLHLTSAGPRRPSDPSSGANWKCGLGATPSRVRIPLSPPPSSSRFPPQDRAGNVKRYLWNACVAPYCCGHLESNLAVGWLGWPNHGDCDGYWQCGHGECRSRFSESGT